jgi:hypothetical protein
MKTKFKRVQEEIETLKWHLKDNSLSESGKEKLNELETLMDYAHSSTLLNDSFKKGDNVLLDNGLKAQILGFKNNLAIVLDERGLKFYKQLHRIENTKNQITTNFTRI